MLPRKILWQYRKFGEKMAKSVEQFFRQKQNRDTVEKLKAAGVNTVSFGKKKIKDNRFEGKTLC